MNSEVGEAGLRAESEDVDDIDEDDFVDDDDESSDNVGDASVEINVEQLVAEVEGSSDACSARKREIRRRLEELAESRSLDDTFAIDFDDN